VTPSQWLADLVKESFLKEYPVKVIHNGIDLEVFKPTGSNFRERHGLVGKKVLLGVAFGWGVRKGLDVFVELARRLPEEYQIVLVGTDDNVDKQLPENIISIHRTQNQRELAEIYTAADLFVNPTREENYPTLNMESLACGTPVLTFRTGGSPESVNEDCGMVIPCDDVDAMEAAILRLERHPLNPEACVCQAQDFDKMKRFAQYCSLYEKIYHE
jgi:glycosyltransferase involved in cell wall biosynthesis